MTEEEEEDQVAGGIKFDQKVKVRKMKQCLKLAEKKVLKKLTELKGREYNDQTIRKLLFSSEESHPRYTLF